MSEERNLTPQGRVLDRLTRVIVGGIVDYPEKIHTVIVESGSTVVVELTVARDDIGKVIGRQGSMARALRTILSNAATKHGRRSVLQIIE
ncbi:MAG: KH domain-containing protein [Myxococcota bacterium]|nr:KH domain-containing protein [Myxococcota bacterium]